MYNDQYKALINLLNEIQANNIDFNTFFKQASEELKYIKNDDKTDNIVLTILENNYDIILSTGFIRELKRIYPKANLIVVLDENIKHFDNLLINNPHINEYFYVNLEASNLLSLIYNCINIGYQYFWNRNITKAFVLSWPGSIAALFFNWLINAKERIGFGESIINIYNNDKQDFIFDKLLTNNIKHPKELTNDLLRKYYILESMGFKIDNKALELFIDKKNDNRKIICVDISNVSPNWVFSIKKITQFLSQIINDNIYIMYKSNDLINERYFISLLTNNIYSDTKNIINKNQLIKYNINLMQNISLYIGNNTETMHIASVYNKPIIAFFAESEDKELDGNLSLYKRLQPYAWLDNPPVKILQPEYALDTCVIQENIGGCCVPYPHCINEITIEQIKNAYNELFPQGI